MICVIVYQYNVMILYTVIFLNCLNKYLLSNIDFKLLHNIKFCMNFTLRSLSSDGITVFYCNNTNNTGSKNTEICLKDILCRY